MRKTDLKDHDGTELWVAYTAFFLTYFTQPCNIGILFKGSHMKSEKDINVFPLEIQTFFI